MDVLKYCGFMNIVGQIDRILRDGKTHKKCMSNTCVYLDQMTFKERHVSSISMVHAYENITHSFMFYKW